MLFGASGSCGAKNPVPCDCSSLGPKAADECDPPVIPEKRKMPPSIGTSFASHIYLFHSTTALLQAVFLLGLRDQKKLPPLISTLNANRN